MSEKLGISINHMEQLDIASHIREERDDLKSTLAEYDDFWEWFEDEYGETKNDVWKKFDEYRDKINPQE